MNDRAFSHRHTGAEANLILDAVDALKRNISIEASLLQLDTDRSATYRADAEIELAYEHGRQRYAVECKFSVDRKAHIDKIHRQLETTGYPGLLIAPHITKELAEHCRATGLQFIDTSGNAYLHAPGLFVLINGEKSERKQPPEGPKGLTNAAALRVVFALLAKPEHVQSPYKELAHHAGVSLGTVYNVLSDLEGRGYLLNKGDSAHRKLLEPMRLVDEWAINYPTTLRTKLKGRRYSAPQPSWWQAADLNGFDVAWGSEIAAKKLTGHLKPATQTLYVNPVDMENVVKTLSKQQRLRPDSDGEIEIMEKFWQWQHAAGADTAPPLLVYSELLALLDPRTQETANMIRERFIDTSFDQG